MSKPPAKRVRSQAAREAIEVGSFSLETMTTGMYEDPFHCIREYIQNGCDAILDARRASVLAAEERGRITITQGGTATRPSLTVRDNGTGIPVLRAFSTLVSLGASRKTPVLHAGFRGIGRLAGIAYCKSLRFKTKAAGEPAATIVEFDCGRLRGYMKPGSDPQDVRSVLGASVRTSTVPEKLGDHYTEVDMIGLTSVGIEFAQIEKLLPYLRQVCPVAYSERFRFASRIAALAASYGEDIPVVEVETRNKKDRFQVFKPYQDVSPVGGTKKNVTSELQDIEMVVSKEHGWYGWIGSSTFMGEITDETVAGIRFRMKNIQIGDSRIIEDITEELSLTDRRLQRYAIGEVFISNPQVVPNARRDGFEDNIAWRNIRRDVRDQIAKRVITLVRAASDSRSVIKKVKTKVDELSLSLNAPKLTQAAASKLGLDLKRQLLALEADKLSGADPSEVSPLVSRLKGLQERLLTIPIENVQVTDPKPNPKPQPAATQPASASAPRVLGADAQGVLDIVREVLVEELELSLADRLMGLIQVRV